MVEVGINGVFLSLDLILFFLFFEVVLLPMYAIIAGWGGPNRRRAGLKFVLYTLLGSVLLLVGVFLIVVKAGTADLIVAVQRPWRGAVQRHPTGRVRAGRARVRGEEPALAAAHLAAGRAHRSADRRLGDPGRRAAEDGHVRPAPRRCRRAARAAPASPRRVLGVLAVAAILVGSLVCLAQTELKRLIAYSSVGHMGFVLLGIATMTTAGFTAALVGNIAHGIVTSLLFFLAGAVKHRTHTGSLADLGGLREHAPVLSGVLGFAAIASLGLPGLAGFWGEAFAVVASLRRGGGLWIVLGCAGRDRWRARGGVLHAAAAPGHARPGHVVHRVRRHRPGPRPARSSRGRRWSSLTLAVGLVPALVLSMAHGPLDLLTAVIR